MMRGVLWILLTTCVAAFGHTDHPLSDAWRWGHFTDEDGLPVSSTLSVLETGDGTLWAGTNAGLAWYDGFQWYPAAEIPGAPPALAPAVLYAAADGRLVTLVANTLYIGNPDRFESISLDQPIEFVAVASDEILLLTRDSGLYRWQPGKLDSLRPPAGMRAQNIAGLRQSDDGSVWLVGQGDLYRYTDGEWFLEQHMELDHPVITSDGTRFASVSLPYEQRGIWSWAPGHEARRVPSSESDLVRDIAVGPLGSVIVLYESGAVLVIDEDEETLLNPGPAELRGAQDITFGDNGDLLVGGGSGVRVYRTVIVPWKRWYTPQGHARNRIDEILVASDGAVWLGTDGGIEIRRPDGSVEWHDSVLGRDLRIITGLGEDDEGGIWVSSGAYWDGAFRYFEDQWAFYGYEQGLHSSRSHRIESDRSGRLWFLGLQGTGGAQRTQKVAIYAFSEGQFSELTIPEPLNDSRIYDIEEDDQGGLWFCGVRGIGRLQDGEWQFWDVDDGLKSNKIFSLAIDKDGRVFFTDQKNGLGLIEADQVSYFSHLDGLIHNSIWDMDLAPDGTLWMATRGGLAGYRDGLWLSFGADTGLEALELWPVATDADRVLIGSAGQGTFILDGRLTQHPPPRVVPLDPLVSENEVVARWRAFAYRGTLSHDQIRTRYRLDSGPWSSWSTTVEARLRAVAAGPHELQVQARDEFGSIGKHIAIPFTVAAPYYQRPAFFIPVGLSGAAVILLLIALIERRRRHALRLRESEDRFRSFFEEAPISLWEHDYSEVRNFLNGLGPHDAQALRRHLEAHPADLFDALKKIRILHVNRATLALLGAQDATQLRNRLHRIFRRASYPAFLDGMMAVFVGDSRFAAQTSIRTLSGQPLEVIMSWAVAPGTTGDYSRILVSVLDITAQHQAAEEMRLAAQAAQEASIAKSAFLANTSHEIRTPINAIMGMAQALQEETLSSAAADGVDTILRASDALTRIIDDLLDLSKIEAGELDLEAVRFQLDDVVEEVRRTVVGSAAAKGLDLIVELRPETHLDLVGDPTRLRQIFLNLVSNAIKFTQTGSVRMSVSARAEGADATVAASIEDSGIGIAPNRLGDIFDPFTQADGSITRTHGGTGLGLSICRRLVELMKGRIDVDSTPGVGSRFSFQVQLIAAASGDEKAPTRQADDEAPAGPIAPRRVLLAEDNELNRKVVRALLRSDRHELIEVENGRLAVEACEGEHDFDVVLMDVQMPEMDGLTATRQIRALEAAGERTHLPIVALTANAMESDRERCLEAGMDAFVAKPVRKQALRRVLASVLDDAEAESTASNTGAGNSDQILDPQPLQDLRELAELDADFSIAGFIELFLTEVPATLAEAQTALEAGDTVALHRHVHTVKGSAREVGAVELGERALHLEQRLKAGDTTGAAEGLRELDQLLNVVSGHLRRIAAQETEKG